MKTRYLILLALGMTGMTAAKAAENTGHAELAINRQLHGEDTTALRCAQIAPSYGVDTTLMNDGSARRWVTSMGSDYLGAVKKCQLQRQAVGQMMASLEKDFELRDGRLWIDESTYLTDHVSFMAALKKLDNTLSALADELTAKEAARLDAERKAAEAAERAKAKAAQEVKDQQLEQLRQSITQQHRQIAMSCDGSGVTDKAKGKELKDLYFAYLSVYNKQDLSDQRGSDDALERFGKLNDFQRFFLDSVVGGNSYSNQIANFKNELKIRCGKEFADVNKSYLKVFKKSGATANFSTYDEFDSYVQQLLEVLTVQRAYTTVVERRQTINKNSAAVVERCAKSHKDIMAAYKAAEAAVEVVPTFTIVAEAEKFVNRLDEFILVQDEYMKVITRIDAIEKRSSAIVTSCPKHSSDVAGAYKTLVANTNFVPTFGELSGASYFNSKLDDFEAVQSCYETIVKQRTTIFQKEESIMAAKLTPKEIVAGYKLIKSRTYFTPDFSSEESGTVFVGQMNEFIALQDKVLGIIATDETIDANTKTIKAVKSSSNFVKSYDRLAKSYDYEISILSEGDLDSYINHQKTILNVQEKFMSLIKQGKHLEMDKQLKKEKDLDRIKLLFEL